MWEISAGAFLTAKTTCVLCHVGASSSVESERDLSSYLYASSNCGGMKYNIVERSILSEN